MSGGYLEEWHIHKNCPYFLTFYEVVVGWVLNPGNVPETA